MARDIKLFVGDGKNHIFSAEVKYDVIDAGQHGKIKGAQTTIVRVKKKWARQAGTLCQINGTDLARLDGEYRTVGDPVDHFDGTVTLRLQRTERGT